MQPVIVIPAYQPEYTLINLTKNLLQHNAEQHIIIVDDGSDAELKTIFNELRQFPTVKVLQHVTNLGKGQALKTAFDYYLLHYPDSVGVVTADADGQHSLRDIERIGQFLMANPNSLCLGMRQFDKHVPLRSRFGNILTRKIFKYLLGRNIKDTQTGLRGIPHNFLHDLLKISSTGYEFELDMLINAAQKPLNIQQVPIETIYIDNNRTSHFNPLLDSLKIYWVFLRFSALSVVSALVDVSIFSFLYFANKNIFISTATARALSGTFNFGFSKHFIFKSDGRFINEAAKYFSLVLVVMIVSYFAVVALVEFFRINVYISKIIADVAIFLTNFTIQSFFVFRPTVKAVASELPFNQV